MTEVEIIRKDEFGKTTKKFTYPNGGCPYEKLVAGEIVEVEIDERGTIRDYVVESLNWTFTHFGNIIVIHIQPVNPMPHVKAMMDVNGRPYWDLSHYYMLIR